MMKLAAALLSLTLAAAAAVPTVMNHQGRIAIAGVNFDGTGHFKFALVDAAGTTTYWSNDATPAGEPLAAVTTPVTKGHYAYLLGTSNPLPAETFAAEDDLRLRIWFSPDGSSFTQLAPDRRLTPNAYAFSAKTAVSLEPGYQTGSGDALSLESIGGTGQLSLAGTFAEAFTTAPAVSFGDGWTVTANDTSGFTAEAEFGVTKIDTRASTGTHSSLAVIAGRPAVAYRNNSEGDLLFARAGDALGSEWPEEDIVRVAGAGISDVGEFASLAEVAGRPAIAFLDATNGDLKFVRADDSEGRSWPAALTVDGATSNTGRHGSLAIVAGKPAISYTSPNSGELVYAEAQDAEGSSWQVTVIEGSLGDYRQFTSLAEVGGEPAIATWNQTGDALRYVYRTAGTTWNGIEVDPGGGSDPSLAIIDGQPAIAYRTAAGELRYVRASSPDGSAWGTAAAIGTGLEVSLTEFGGRPAVSYYSGTLVFATAADAAGTSWPGASKVGIGTLSAGFQSSMIAVDGLPAIAHYDALAGHLNYAKLPAARWVAETGAAQPILASGISDGGVTEAMLSDRLVQSLADKDEEIAELRARIEALESAVFGASN